jgi:hypothetical protein
MPLTTPLGSLGHGNTLRGSFTGSPHRPGLRLGEAGCFLPNSQPYTSSTTEPSLLWHRFYSVAGTSVALALAPGYAWQGGVSMCRLVTRAALVACLLLSGCKGSSPPPSPTISSSSSTSPRGETGLGYSTECRELEACYKQAREFCPSGHTMIDQATEHRGQTAWHTLTFECK